MGSFAGHIGPGTAFLLIGIPAFFRALDVSFFKRYRFSKQWVFYEAYAKVIYCVIGWLWEYKDMVVDNNYTMSHFFHLRLFTLMGGSGIVDLLHQYKILKEPGWALVSPVCYVCVGFLFSVHPQNTLARTDAHLILSWLKIILGLSKAVEVLISTYLNRAHHTTFHQLEKSAPAIPSSINILCAPCRSVRYERGILIGINPMYTNPVVFGTMAPLVSATVINLIGAWWIVLGFVFYNGPVDHMAEMDHHGMELITSLSFWTFLYVMGMEITIAAVLAWLDYGFGKSSHGEEVLLRAPRDVEMMDRSSNSLGDQ